MYEVKFGDKSTVHCREVILIQSVHYQDGVLTLTYLQSVQLLD